MLKLRQKAKMPWGFVTGMVILFSAYLYVSNEHYKDVQAEQEHCQSMVDLGAWPEEACK